MSGADRFLADHIGLRVDGATRTRLARLARDAARHAACPEETLGRLLAGDPLRAQDLIDRVTVQESGFFRHPEQFALLATHLRSLDPPGVIWSAGCANGQEPWSLAMLLEEHGLTRWSVLATDVSAAALERARAATYNERELRRLDERYRRRFVAGEAIVPRLRERVRFLHHNLAAAPPPPEAADCRVVLCRNVLIYMHRPAIDAFLAGLRRRMPAGGLLLLGMGEALGPLEGFRPGPVAGSFVRGAPASRPEATDVPEPALPTVTQLLAEGNRLAGAGELDAAAMCFRRAGFLDPADARPPERLAAVLDRIAGRG